MEDGPPTEARGQHEQGQILATEVMRCPPLIVSISQWNRKMGVKTGHKVLEVLEEKKRLSEVIQSVED